MILLLHLFLYLLCFIPYFDYVSYIFANDANENNYNENGSSDCFNQWWSIEDFSIAAKNFILCLSLKWSHVMSNVTYFFLPHNRGIAIAEEKRY